MAPSFRRIIRLKRRLLKWQIFFIAIGGLIGFGFVNGPSKMLGVSGPGGVLLATMIVGIIAAAVMESICHLICIWPIPNAMVEFVKAFVDEDLGTTIGVLYWYTYCVTFSYLISTIGKLTDYWGEVYLRKTGVYLGVPILLLMINMAPVEVFGWVELIGGIIKLALVIFVFVLMLLLNLGVNSGVVIGTTFIDSAVQFNENAAHSKFAAVSSCIPPAIFAYIGVELLTTTAFEAREPSQMRLPARNIGWFTFAIYSLTAGVFVSNVAWTDSNLPQFFNQTLTMSTTSFNGTAIHWADAKINSQVHMAPLIVLLRLGYKFLPKFINCCLIYSVFSCANTALYVASRQLYGLTRSITVTNNSNFVRKFFGWLGQVEHRTRAPWPALFISVLLLYWLPFLRRDNNYQKMEDVQSILAAAGSISCILVWCSQCVAYCFFYHWRAKHWDLLEQNSDYRRILDYDNTGLFYVCQPYLSNLAAFSTLAIVVFFNTASMWNGKRIDVKATSAFASPCLLVVVYLIKKFTRPRMQWKFWNNLDQWFDFESRIQYLNALIFPVDPDAQSEHEFELSGGTIQHVKPFQAVNTEGHSNSDISTIGGNGNGNGNPTINGTVNSTHPPAPEPFSFIGNLQLTPHDPSQLSQPTGNNPNTHGRNQFPTPSRDASISPIQREELPATHHHPVSTRHEPPPNSPPSDLPSPPPRFYNGRSTLAPHDAISRPGFQPLSPPTEAELVDSTTTSGYGISPISENDGDNVYRVSGNNGSGSGSEPRSRPRAPTRRPVPGSVGEYIGTREMSSRSDG